MAKSSIAFCSNLAGSASVDNGSVDISWKRGKLVTQTQTEIDTETNTQRHIAHLKEKNCQTPKRVLNTFVDKFIILNVLEESRCRNGIIKGRNWT